MWLNFDKTSENVFVINVKLQFGCKIQCGLSANAKSVRTGDRRLKQSPKYTEAKGFWSGWDVRIPSDLLYRSISKGTSPLESSALGAFCALCHTSVGFSAFSRAWSDVDSGRFAATVHFFRRGKVGASKRFRNDRLHFDQFYVFHDNWECDKRSRQPNTAWKSRKQTERTLRTNEHRESALSCLLTSRYYSAKINSEIYLKRISKRE